MRLGIQQNMPATEMLSCLSVRFVKADSSFARIGQLRLHWLGSPHEFPLDVSMSAREIPVEQNQFGWPFTSSGSTQPSNDQFIREPVARGK